MPLWKNTDAAANSVISAPAQVHVAPNTANRDELFNNANTDLYLDGAATVGMYGISTDEQRALRGDEVPRPAHAGWVLRTEGTGNRAGRVKYETLVAMSSITGDATDDTVAPDYSLSFTINPEDEEGASYE